jgi:hypothetical protein
MKYLYKLIIIILLEILFETPGIVIAQEKPEEASQEELMATYTELGKPGEEHKILATLAGIWNMDIKVWWQPGSDSMTFQGTCQNKMILGGRFLLSESQGGEEEMYTETHILIGFDRRHKKFTQVGFDTWGTYYVTASGPYDEKTRTITMYGEDEDPIVGKTQKYNMIIRFVDENRYITEVVFKDFRTPNQEPFKSVEIIYTKK